MSKVIREGRWVFFNICDEQGKAVLHCRDLYAVNFCKFDNGVYTLSDEDLGILLASSDKKALKREVQSEIIAQYRKYITRKERCLPSRREKEIRRMLDSRFCCWESEPDGGSRP